MTTEEHRVTVTATVAGKGQYNGKDILQLNIPEFKSKYPISFNRWPAGFRDSVELGETLTLILKREGLKQGKEGQFQTDYWWGIVGVDEQEPETQDIPGLDAGAKREAINPSVDRQDLIMLQHASGVVAQAYGDWVARQPMEAVPQTFSDYLKAVAQGATWYLHQVYQKGGYAPVATQRGHHDTPAQAAEEEEGEPY